MKFLNFCSSSESFFASIFFSSFLLFIIHIEVVSKELTKSQLTESRDEMDEEKIEKGILVKERGENAGYLDENDKESCDPCNERIDIMAERSQENTGIHIEMF